MGSYAAPNPNKDLVCPPVADNSKSHAQMGFNHIQLGKMLCPVKYLTSYIKDPHGYVLFIFSVNCINGRYHRMKSKFDSRSLKVTAALL
jgi:hypothetical protein